MIVQDIIVKNPVPIQRNIVVAWTSRVKNIIERLSDAMIIYGRDFADKLFALAQSMTGKSGRTQGASIVKIPAKKDTMSKVILYRI